MIKTIHKIQLPTENDLPDSNGEPMDNEKHFYQLQLLIEPLRTHFEGQRVYVHGNMFIYFTSDQLKGKYFRGPDFFVVLDVEPRLRKSWVVWEEGKGPDLIIELISESTATVDKEEKFLIYQDQLRVPEYFWYDPDKGEWAGFILKERKYQPIKPDEYQRLISLIVNLALVKWQGKYQGIEGEWLRWSYLDGRLLLTGLEKAEIEKARVEIERQRFEREQKEKEKALSLAEAEKQRAEREQKEKEKALSLAEAEKQRADKLVQRLKELGVDIDQ